MKQCVFYFICFLLIRIPTPPRRTCYAITSCEKDVCMRWIYSIFAAAGGILVMMRWRLLMVEQSSGSGTMYTREVKLEKIAIYDIFPFVIQTRKGISCFYFYSRSMLPATRYILLFLQGMENSSMRAGRETMKIFFCSLSDGYNISSHPPLLCRLSILCRGIVSFRVMSMGGRKIHSHHHHRWDTLHR